MYKRQPISGCVEPDISDDFGIQKDNALQSKLSAPAADAVMTNHLQQSQVRKMSNQTRMSSPKRLKKSVSR